MMDKSSQIERNKMTDYGEGRPLLCVQRPLQMYKVRTACMGILERNWPDGRGEGVNGKGRNERMQLWFESQRLN